MSTATETEPTIDEKIDLAKRNMKDYVLVVTLNTFATMISLAAYTSAIDNYLFTKIGYLPIAIAAIAFATVYMHKLFSKFCTFLELLAEKHAH